MNLILRLYEIVKVIIPISKKNQKTIESTLTFLQDMQILHKKHSEKDYVNIKKLQAKIDHVIEVQDKILTYLHSQDLKTDLVKDD